MTRIIDISRTLSGATPVWPGDLPFRLEKTMAIGDGDPVNLSILHASPHTGTHTDAPLHVREGRTGVGALPLEPFVGAARVVTVSPGDDRLIHPGALDGIDPADPPRILLRTGSDPSPKRFHEDFPSIALETAELLVERGIVLVGIDTPGVDLFGNLELPVHRYLADNDIRWLENLDLSAAGDGIYTLAALPLKIEGGDGSPVRAILIQI